MTVERPMTAKQAQKRLLELYCYDPATGVVTRRLRNGLRGRVGSAVGWKMRNGYLQASVDYKKWLLHRLIWVMQTGEWPKGDIDHVNRKRDDNRWRNLRDVSRSRNLSNRKMMRSAPAGIDFDEKHGKYRVRITRYLGSFDSAEEAQRVRDAAVRALDSMVP